MLTSPCPTQTLVQQACPTVLNDPDQLPEDQWANLLKLKQGRLGRYFEVLVTSILATSPHVLDMRCNIPILDGKRTHGELDCIYQTRTEGWVHLELAVKFYLGYGDLSRESNWHGPALRDNLGKKLDRLTQHQLPLPYTELGRETLEPMGIRPVRSDALVLGRLFRPAAPDTPLYPETINPDCDGGWWRHEEQWRNWTEKEKWQWRFIRKPDWFAPTPASGIDNPKSPLPQPIMAVGFEGGRETTRGFLVPDDWGPKA